MGKLVVAGSSNTDMVVKTSRFPLPGETVLGGQFFMFPGGKGANQAVAAARSGGEVVFLCCLGDDVFGQKALETYKQEGLDTGHIRVLPGEASGTALITVDETGENQIVVAPGANQGVTPEYIRSKASLLQSANLILTQLETPLEAVEALAATCRESGVPLILNPAPAARLRPELFEGLFGLTPNQTEAEALTGIPVRDKKSAAEAASRLCAMGVIHAVITMGNIGALYQGSEGSFFVEAQRVEAVDTTAAGDVFNGVLAASLAQGQSWKKSLNRAGRAAALSVTRMGAQQSAPYAHEIL